MGSFKGQSIEDMLRQQIEKREFYDGGSEKNPPSGGGGGGGGGVGGDGSGESEDEGLVGIIDETMQVILATIGFIFLVIISFFSSALVAYGRSRHCIFSTQCFNLQVFEHIYLLWNRELP